MKQGDMVECIRARDAQGLTQGKWYRFVSYVGPGQMAVENDGGHTVLYAASRFETVEQKEVKPVPARLKTREG